MCSAGVIAAAGDAVAQITLAGDHHVFDARRTLKMTCAATFLHAPLWHTWFKVKATRDATRDARAHGAASSAPPLPKPATRSKARHAR